MPKTPPALPCHLSYKSALVLLPPTSLQPPIEGIREKHDRNFNRWPPHINLIYPFLNQPSGAKESIRSRIEGTVAAMAPIDVTMRNANYFRHSKSSATVYLEPKTASALKDLQAKLQRAFAECDADNRDFTPHLSLGQARGDVAAQGLIEEIDETMRLSKPIDTGSEPDEDRYPWCFQWTADRVYVLERHGFKGRFKVVDEVPLGTHTG